MSLDSDPGKLAGTVNPDCMDGETAGSSISDLKPVDRAALDRVFEFDKKLGGQGSKPNEKEEEIKQDAM